jgi:adenylate cyclase
VSRKKVPIPDPQPVGGPSSEERLDSWKEVAAYLHRTARTVQRWEREQGLPVHRLQHVKRGSIYAYKPELDAWWESRRLELENEVAPAISRPEVSGLSIAVLPFVDMSPERDQDYFCEGVAEEISGALSRIEGLRVASRSSAFRFKAGANDVVEVGRKLRVTHLLEGSVRKAADQLRISVQLADARTGFQIWSDRFDRTMQDIFAIQDEIANRVVRALEIELSAREKVAIREKPTDAVQAYDYYLKGRKYYYSYGPRDMDFAIQLLTKAVTVDAGFALAYAGLADCWSYLYLYAERSDIVREQAEWAGAKAVELAPDSAQSHASYAVALSLVGKEQQAEAGFEKALSLDPDQFEANYYYARHCFVLGQREKAMHYYAEAIRVQPEDYQSPLLVAQSYEDGGDSEQAAALRQEGIRLAEQHLALNPEDVRAIYMAANGMVALGQVQRGVEWAERAAKMRPDDGMLLYNVGCIYSMAGRIEAAIDALEKSSVKGVTQKGWYEHDSNLAALRGHSRFQALLDTL